MNRCLIEVDRFRMEESAAERRAQMEAALQAELAQHEATLERAREDLAGVRNLANSIILAAREEAEKVRQQSERWVTTSQTHRMEIRSHIDQIRQLLVFAVTSEAGEEASKEQTQTLEIDPEDRPGEEQSAAVEEHRAPTAPVSAAPQASRPPSQGAPDPAGVGPTVPFAPPA